MKWFKKKEKEKVNKLGNIIFAYNESYDKFYFCWYNDDYICRIEPQIDNYPYKGLKRDLKLTDDLCYFILKNEIDNIPCGELKTFLMEYKGKLREQKLRRIIDEQK